MQSGSNPPAFSEAINSADQVAAASETIERLIESRGIESRESDHATVPRSQREL